MRARLIQFLPALFVLVTSVLNAGEPIVTAFTYRGNLSVGGMPAAGTYDLRFTLFDEPTNGVEVAPAITNLALSLNNGLFNAALDFGQSAFNGDRRWLEIGVRTNSSGEDFETLQPRQELGAQAYALFALRAGSAAVAQSLEPGAWIAPLSLTNPANVFTGDGSGLTTVDAVTLGGLTSGDFWRTGGNLGTQAGNNFLGTIDNQPLEFKVNNARGFRLEPTTVGSPNIIGGAPANFVSPGIGGATIAGGGSAEPGEANSVLSAFGTIGGGSGNSIADLQTYGTIAGGHSNLLGSSFAANSTIGGGFSNVVWVSSSVIAGGEQNLIGLPFDMWGIGHTVGGGVGNHINYQNEYSTISGGADNFLDASDSVISGGTGNSIYWVNGAAHSIGGGSDNQVWALWGGTVGGGGGNAIGSHSTGLGGDYSTISGGESNLSFGGSYSAISGGQSNVAEGPYSTVPGGAQAHARLYGQLAYASGQFDSAGDAQTSVYVCRGTTSGTTAGELFLDGTSQRMVIATNSTWAFEIVVAGRAVNGNSAAYQIRGAIKNNLGATSFVGTPVKTVLGEDVSSWDTTITADSANEALAIHVTGAAATAIRWVANVRTTELSY